MSALVLVAVVLVLLLLGLLLVEKIAGVAGFNQKLTMLLEAVLILLAIVYLAQRVLR